MLKIKLSYDNEADASEVMDFVNLIQKYFKVYNLKKYNADKAHNYGRIYVNAKGKNDCK